jgi:hypothetical protein
VSRWLIELKVLWDTQRPKMLSLGVLAVAFLIMFGRNVIAPGLRSASAATADRPASQQAGLAANEPASGGKRETVVCATPPPFGRDVFAFDRDHFPLPNTDDESRAIEPKSSHLPDEDTQGSAEPTREQIEAGVREEARALELRSLIVGGTPLAVIEVTGGASRGRHVLEAGESLLGFRIVEVRKGSVVIEKDGVSVELFRADGQ